MYPIFKLIILVLFFHSVFLNVKAEEITDRGFIYKGGSLSYLVNVDNKSSDLLITAWNAERNDMGNQLLKPGLKVFFWGKPVGCDLKMSTGPVTSKADWLFSQAETVTGIPLDPKRSDLKWAPTGGGDRCSKESQQLAGPSFVHINESIDRGGIGLFSNTGANSNNEKFFLRQYDKAGKNNKGANAYNQGTFVNFRFSSSNEKPIYPFGMGKNISDGKPVIINSRQNVSHVKIASYDAGSKRPNQAKQQITVTFHNTECMKTRVPTSICQIKYLFNVAVFREGIADWKKELWFDKGVLLFDPGQNGVPVFHGPIKSAGIDTMAREDSQYSLWKSLGSETFHQTFAPTEFTVEISYPQFLSAIKIVTAEAVKTSTNKVTAKEISKYFGPSWDLPESWRLLGIAVGQEVHNNDLNTASSIGGGIESLSVNRK